MTQPNASFVDDICTAVCDTVLKADGAIDADALHEAIGDQLRAEFGRRVTHLERALDLVEQSDHGSADTAFAIEQDLQAARDAEGDLFAAGYSRLNRAVNARGDTITIAPQTFNPDTMTLHVDANDFDVEPGDTVLAALSLNDDAEGLDMDIYPLFRTDTGLHCAGPDKNRSNDFPVCKHELVALLQLAVHLCDSDTTVPPGRDAHAAVLDHADRLLANADTADTDQPTATQPLTATL